MVSKVSFDLDCIGSNPTHVVKNGHLVFISGLARSGSTILTRLLYGTKISISVGLVAVSIALIIGIPLGLFSAYYGKIVDSVIMRFMDALAAFPAILLALAILSVLGPSIHNAMIGIGIVYLPAFSRVIRGSVLSVKNNEFVH